MIPRAGFGCWLTAWPSGRPGANSGAARLCETAGTLGSHASPFPLHRLSGPPAHLEADWPGDPANILPDWTVPTDGCFPGLTCTALTRWPVALRVTCRNTAISSSLVSLKSAASKSAASHSCIRWWTPRVSALPFFVSSGSTIRRSSPGYRRVIRPNLTGLFTARLIRDTLTGNTWLSWVVVHFSRPGGAGAARAPRATGRGTI